MNSNIEDYAGKEKGRRCLIIAGGSSGVDWKRIRDQVQPDFLLGLNAAKNSIPNLDYWLCHENIDKYLNRYRNNPDDEEARRYIEGWQNTDSTTRPGVCFINRRILNNFTDPETIVPIRSAVYRKGLFRFRKYGRGLLCGSPMQHVEGVDGNIHKKMPVVGTALSRGIHLAGILGASEIHTIGADLCFRGESDHWYDFPAYNVETWRTEKMFVEYAGVRTQWIWIETAQFLKTLEPQMAAEGITWRDWSNGLLSIEGLKCAQP